MTAAAQDRKKYWLRIVNQVAKIHKHDSDNRQQAAFDTVLTPISFKALVKP